MKKLFIIIFITSLMFCFSFNTFAFSMYGSNSPEVIKIQEKLSSLGIYSGSNDGFYSFSLCDAVKKFQSFHNIFPDGVCTSETLKLLGVEQTEFLENEDKIVISARFISSLGLKENIEMLCIGAVIKNRLDSPLFSNDCNRVIAELTKYCNSKPAKSVSFDAYRCAFEAFLGTDPTFGATHFTSKNVSSRWVDCMEKTVSYGECTFYKFNE